MSSGLYMIVRARRVRPYQLPSGSLNSAGMASSSAGRLDRLEQALLGRRDEVAGVDGDVDVGFGVLALGGEPLAELAVVAGLELELDPGLVLELLERGLDAVVPAAVDLQRLAVVATAAGQRRAGQDGDGRGDSVNGVVEVMSCSKVLGGGGGGDG